MALGRLRVTFSSMTELQRFLKNLAAEPRSGRYAVLRWRLEVEYYSTSEAAERRISKLPPIERAGVVDRELGNTRCSAKAFASIVSRLARDGRSENLRHVGPLKPRVSPRNR